MKGVRKIKRSIFSLSLKFLHGIRVNSEPFNPSMTKYRMATKDFSTLEVTSTQETMKDRMVSLLSLLDIKQMGKTIFNGPMQS